MVNLNGNIMNEFKGQCLCGGCRYRINGAVPFAMYLCHCSRCRKETGTIHGANAFFKNAQLSWERGEEHIRYFTLEHTRKKRAFCTICGSPLPHQNSDLLVVPAGTVDDDSALKPTAHIFCNNRAPWEDDILNLPRFDELPV